MYEDKKFEIKEPKENLHWINYNTKQILKVLKELQPIVDEIRKNLKKPPNSTSSDEIPF